MKSITYAIRVLLKNKFYSFLNIFGLAIGLSVSMIILLYVQKDFSFDKHHENWDQLYRIESKFKIGPKDDEFALTSVVLAEMMQEAFPEIQSYTRFQNAGRQLFRKGEQKFYVDNMVFADSSVFNNFTHEFIYGDPNSALDEINSIVLTESVASRIYGNDNPLNEILETDNNRFKVTGVIKDMPDNVHLTYDGLISLHTQRAGQPPLTAQQKSGQLWNIALYSYLKLPKNYDVNQIYNKFPDFFDQYMAPLARQANLGDANFAPRLVPLNEIHFKSNVQYDLPTGNMAYTRSFMAIGIFILILASINYMNLATARATNRSKEVGVRKVLGSTRAKLRGQFMSESLIIAFFSLLLAILIVNILIQGTGLNDLLNKDLRLDFLHNPVLLFGSLGVTLLIGLLSGLYPAFYLSAISVLVAMKGSVKTGPGSLFLRKVLVAFQFFVSIGVVISTLLMSDQISFMRNKDLGFNKDNVILIPMQDVEVRNRIDFIKAELMQNPNIVGVTDALGIGGGVSVGNSLLGAGRQLLQAEQQEDSTFTQDTFNVLRVGKDYTKTMQMEIVAGRDFNEDMPTDITQKVLVNEALVAKMSWDDPIDKVVSPIGAQPPTRVIGVVKDFHAFSLHMKVEPTVIFRYPIQNLPPQALPTFLVNVKSGTLSQALSFLEGRFTELDEKHPFEYRFLDQQAEDLYKADQRQSSLTGILSYICILISCLGLLGLSSFTTSTRIKEIGVRKVLGATVPQLVFMIFKDIMVLVLIGFVIATPVAYLLIEDWLQVFEYRMPLQTVIVAAAAMSGILSLVIAFLTVSFHSLRAARQNPVRALRYE
jgi:putative ABC transport system permease protein